jgi:hypothetical protein
LKTVGWSCVARRAQLVAAQVAESSLGDRALVFFKQSRGDIADRRSAVKARVC